MKYICSIILFVLAMDCHADTDFRVSLSSEQVQSSSDLGNVDVAGVGAVNLVAHKTGNQLVVRAQDINGKVIGKAETVVGLKDTPIYILTSGGLEKITIYWGTN